MYLLTFLRRTYMYLQMLTQHSKRRKQEDDEETVTDYGLPLPLEAEEGDSLERPIVILDDDESTVMDIDVIEEELSDEEPPDEEGTDDFPRIDIHDLSTYPSSLSREEFFLFELIQHLYKGVACLANHK